MRNTQELNDYVSRNYSHNYSNLTNIIWRTLTKNNFFLKLNVRSGNHNYWTLDLDYDFSYNMPLKKSDILANKSIPSKSKKIQNFDENLQLSTQDPFLDKHLIFLNKGTKKLMHQSTMAVVLIIKAFQSDKPDLTIIEITNRVNKYLGNTQEHLVLRNKLLKLIKAVRYFQASCKPEYEIQHWRLNPEYDYAEVQGAIDLQVRLNQVFDAEALFHESIFQDNNIAGNILVTKLILLAILKSSLHKLNKRDICKFIRGTYGITSSNLDYLVLDSLARNDFFIKIDITSSNTFNWTIDSQMLLNKTKQYSTTQTKMHDNSYLKDSNLENIELDINSQKRSLNTNSGFIVNKKLALSKDDTKRKALQSIENRVGMITSKKATDNKEN